MSYSNGLLSSPTTSSTHGPPGPPGIGFKLTGDGNYDIDGKRLTNVSQPIDARDVATKAYIDVNKLDVILRDGSQNMTGNLDMNNNKLTSLADSTDDNDAVNLKVLKNYTQFHQNNYHLQPSFKFYKEFGDKSQLTVGSPPNTPSNHFFQNHKMHNDVYIIEKEADDTGFSGEAWSSMKMKGNQLESGSYTSIFEIFVIDDAGGFNVDDTIIYHVYGDSHHTINTFNSNKTNGQYTKSIIQFTTDGRAGADDGIKFQIKYFGSQYNKNIKFLFYSRVIKGTQSTSFDHTIFNVHDVVDNHTILYFENLNLNGNLIDGLSDPVAYDNAVNKKYVDVENIKQNIAIADKASKSYVDGEIAKIDTTPLLPRDGSREMFGDLKIGDKHILNVKNVDDHQEDDGYVTIVKDLRSVVNKGYLNEKFIKKTNKDGEEYFDLKQNIIKNCEPYYDGLFDNNSLVSKAFVDAEISKLPKPDTDVLKLDGSKGMTGNLNMGDNAIIGIRSSAVDDSALTVGGAKATYFPLLGNHSMQGNLNMGGNAITNIKPFVEDDSSQAASDAQKNQVINFGYFHTERGELKRLINEVGYDALNRKDPDPMEDDIDMANYSIINLKDPRPSDNSHAASVNFVNNTINNNNFIMVAAINDKIKESEEKSIQAVNQENVFAKVMVDDLFIIDDDDIHKVAVVDNDFHKVNQQTYEFKIDYDSEIKYYSTRLGVNVVYLPRNYYTIVFEMYFSNKIDPDNITVNATSGTLSVSKTNTKKSADHTRSVINFRKSIIYPADDELDIDIALKNKAGESYDSDTHIFVVVYGVAGTQNDVDVRLWDRYFYFDDNKINFEESIDMNGKKITGVANGTANNDVITKSQLDEFFTRYNYYYYTYELKHENSKQVEFENFNKYPFNTNSSTYALSIQIDGFYHILYTDYYKGVNDVFRITKNTTNIFIINVYHESDWTPFILNTVIEAHAGDYFQFSIHANRTIFKGNGYSTFYIKYLHP